MSNEAQAPRRSRTTVTSQRRHESPRQRDSYLDHTTDRLQSLRDAMRVVRQGDFSVRLPADAADATVMEDVVTAFNALVAQNEAFVDELARIRRTVGIEGRTSDRAVLAAAAGSWRVAAAHINDLIETLAWPITEVTAVLELVEGGEFTRDLPLRMNGTPLQGDFDALSGRLAGVVNRLRTVCARVSRVIREMGTEGKLGGQAEVDGLGGTWRMVIDDLNVMSSTLNAQVRSIASVSTAIARGDLSQKITVETRGETLEVKNAINATVDSLRTMAAEVIRARAKSGPRASSVHKPTFEAWQASGRS
jgi:HAMP domain-containing protein